jgi:2-keto-3-deoxy-L-rhamnonate aldolase RhmA
MEFSRKTNEQLIVNLQIETVEAVKNLEQFLTIKGIDAFSN